MSTVWARPLSPRWWMAWMPQTAWRRRHLGLLHSASRASPVASSAKPAEHEWSLLSELTLLPDAYPWIASRKSTHSLDPAPSQGRR
eukprot:CAMPEP_0184561042 /NCGR_PEP_ID=MMETSP0199_2-20130426/47243_1 /TAXON_ID=1112570 /ORGANISM="Thraustochytrium sp., Strain LLF1b" /LENGTH=85 /DNA_ID=CAMNT_0026958353 /DNA_START=487 /DNA_END=744 /DNA_ORIENTATION=+